MTKETKLKYLRRFRFISLPAVVLLVGWFTMGAVGHLYTVRARPVRLADSRISLFDYGKRPSLENYLSVIRQRTIFKQSVIYETRTKEVTNALGDLAFSGVVRQGQKLRAFISNKKTSQSSLYSVGETVGDLEIQEIRDDRVIFRHGDESLELIR